MSKEAMKLALEALKFDGFTPEDATHRFYHVKAIKVLEEALAKQEEQTSCDKQGEPCSHPCGDIKCAAICKRHSEQEQGEPVAHFGSAYINENGVHITTVLGPVAIPQNAKLYLEPQQRKPLTDDEFTTAIEVEGIPVEDVELVWAIKDLVEAAHGIKE